MCTHYMEKLEGASLRHEEGMGGCTRILHDERKTGGTRDKIALKLFCN